jgi:hypothetical protein
MARIVVIAALVVAVAIIGWTIGSTIVRPVHRVTHDKPSERAALAEVKAHKLKAELGRINRGQ